MILGEMGLGFTDQEYMGPWEAGLPSPSLLCSAGVLQALLLVSKCPCPPVQDSHFLCLSATEFPEPIEHAGQEPPSSGWWGA